MITTHTEREQWFTLGMAGRGRHSAVGTWVKPSSKTEASVSAYLVMLQFCSWIYNMKNFSQGLEEPGQG